MSNTPDRKPWFHPKTYGYGAGLPMSWEGWLVLVVMIGGVVAALQVTWLRQHPILLLIGILVWTFAFLPLIRARTDGDWRWRWGGK